MIVTETTLPGVLLIRPTIYPDDRGYFVEVHNPARWSESAFRLPPFVQDNQSVSRRGVLRGLHFQNPGGQGKLIHVIDGEIFDVAVDVRRGSPHFGRWVGHVLSSSTHEQLYIPDGFAHGFCVLGERAVVLYKCTDLYQPAHERAVRWDDPEIGIDWPIADPVLNAKDAAAPALRDIPVQHLPEYRPAG